MSSLRVLVTGAASGLGAALADQYLDRGARVLLADRAVVPPAAVERARAAGGDALGLDVTDEEGWAAAVEWVDDNWGGLDVLVNNAGVAGGGRIELCDIDEWRWITEVNLFGVVRGVRAFTPMLKRQRSGLVVNVASLAGLVHPAGMGSYNAVKAAVVAFTETIGFELAPFGVAAAVVCPSYFRTNLMASMQGRDAKIGAVISGLVEGSSLTAADVAAEILAALERGETVVLPDEAARGAVRLKRDDPRAYRDVMVGQAAKLVDAVEGE